MILSKTKNRSGITLLFVISMIVLFLLMGASFVIMTTQFRRSAVDHARIQTHRDDARTLVSRAFYDVFRGPTLDNVFSPLRGTSILADQYGYGARANVVDATIRADIRTASGDQFFVVDLGTTFQHILDDTFQDFSDQEGEYDGQILTFVSGPASGISTRIVSYQVNLDPTTGVVLSRQFVLMPQWNDNSYDFTTIASLSTLNGSGVVINGRPFSGTGVGLYTSGTALNVPALDAAANTPNRVGETRGQLISSLFSRNDGFGAVNNPAAPNENWDAVDVQNMHLAGIGNLDSTGTLSVIPSYYRNGIVDNGGFGAFGSGSAIIEVDNDNDGTPDGIWIDTGMPLQTDMKGRVYKPLVSYLIVDMDGKANVNAAGNLMHVDGKFITAFPDLLGPPSVSGAVDVALGGQGYGPPEINMSTIFTVGDYSFLLKGDPGGVLVGTPITGRYGVDELPGQAGIDTALFGKMPNYPLADFASRGLVGGFYGSPMDLHGRLSYAYSDFSRTLSVAPYDHGAAPVANVPIGMPIANIAGSSLINERINNPYEMDFSGSTFTPSTGADTPFSAREMERVLRLYDHDAVMLPPRLRAMTNESLTINPDIRWDFTTDSWELPVTPTHLVRRLRRVLMDELGIDPDGDDIANDSLDNIFLNFHINTMLSPELRRGQRMNVNRLLGNGFDDNGDGVVDDPAETFAIQTLPTVSGFGADMGVGPLSHQQFARHLYILALLVTEQGLSDVATYDYNLDGTINIDDIYRYRTDIAQWAINVANFRDPDSIMQPFEVDLEPWDGWHVNGILDDNDLAPAGPGSFEFFQFYGSDPAGTGLEDPTTKTVVWGLERPELLMTESAAFHDRRTQDLTTDSSGDDVAGGDDDLDSQLVPRASVLFELYNPWAHSATTAINANNQVKPAEFYGAFDGVVLQKTSLDGTSPVWRILVTNGNGHNQDPDGGELDPMNNLDTADIIRRVYFTEPDVSVVNDEPDFRKVYYSDIALADGGIVSPGQHAVVGSTGVGTDGIAGDTHHIFLGRKSTLTWAAELATDTRRISMNPVTEELELVFFDAVNASWETITRSGVVTLPIGVQENGATDLQRSLGITDPVQSYEELVAPAMSYQAVEDGFQFVDATSLPAARDMPVDQQFNNSEWAIPGTPGLKDDGLHRITEDMGTPIPDEVGRVAHLQRLANPLEPFDAVLNPYLTVDSLGVPVNVFNGVSTERETDATTHFDHLQGMVATNFNAVHFKSYERGETDADVNMMTSAAADYRQRWLWKAPQHGHLTPSLTLATPADQSFVSFNLDNSLGEYDENYRSLTFASAFPWLTWNNRPYSSHLELANVPFTSSYRLLSYFDVKELDRNNYNPPDEGSPVNAANASIPNIAGDYGHLMGFHAHTDDSPRLQTILDYLEVPSRFLGTETFLNESDFAFGAPGAGLGFTPPFHSISNYRYPGKVNINTVFSERGWNAIMGPYASEVTYADINESRRGGTTLPVTFDAPFRFTETINNFPIGSTIPATADTGLFRRDDTTVDSETTMMAETGLFDMDSMVLAPRIDPERSPYFRNDMRQRLGNLVTNRSSVYSIWITIGFFEVDENLNLGAEVGSEAGEVQRYRGFYMVDRSIPVAFEPGFNHNVDEAILTSSITERAITRD